MRGSGGFRGFVKFLQRRVVAEMLVIWRHAKLLNVTLRLPSVPTRGFPRMRRVVGSERGRVRTCVIVCTDANYLDFSVTAGTGAISDKCDISQFHRLISTMCEFSREVYRNIGCRHLQSQHNILVHLSKTLRL